MNRALLLLIRLQPIQCFRHELSSQLFFLPGWQFGIAGDMHDAVTQDDAVEAHHLGDRFRGGNLHDRDADFFQLGRDRSVTASAGASRRRKDDGIDPSFFNFSAISRPRRRVFDSGFERPQVEMNSSCSLPMTPFFPTRAWRRAAPTGRDLPARIG